MFIPYFTQTDKGVQSSHLCTWTVSQKLIFSLLMMAYIRGGTHPKKICGSPCFPCDLCRQNSERSHASEFSCIKSLAEVFQLFGDRGIGFQGFLNRGNGMEYRGMIAVKALSNELKGLIRIFP